MSISNAFEKYITWAITGNVVKCQIDTTNDQIDLWNLHSLENNDKISCYANVSIQCMFHSSVLRSILFCLEHTNVMRRLINCYVSNTEALNKFSIGALAGDQYLQNIKQDAGQFITDLINNNTEGMKNIIEHHICVKTRCKIRNYTNIEIQSNNILELLEKLEKSYTLQELIEYNFKSWKNSEKVYTHRGESLVIKKKEIIITKNIFILKLSLFKIANNKTFKTVKITNLKIKSV